MPCSQRPSRRAPGSPRRSQPKRSAPSRRHATRLREENGWPVSGCTSGSLRIRSCDRVDPGRVRQLVHRRLQRVHARALARRAQPRRRRHVERHQLVRGPPVLGGVHPARADRGLLGELLHPRGLLDRLVRDREQPPVGVAAEPQPLDRRRAVAGVGEHLLARRGDLDGPLRRPWRRSPPARRSGAAGPWSRSRRRRAGRSRAPARARARTAPRACATRRRRPASSRRASTRRRPRPRRSRAAPSGCCGRRASCTSRRPSPRPRRAPRPGRPGRSPTGTPG